MTRRGSHRARAAGYSFVELLMSLSILTIGVGGIVAMQKVALTSSQHARNLATATQISQSWLDALRADAVAWNRASPSDLGETQWLSALASSGGLSTGWIRPAWNLGRFFGPGFDVQGKPVNTSVSTNNPQVRFCTHVRLSWLYRDTGSTVADQDVMSRNGLIRTEVRVFWVRDGQAGHSATDVCGGATSVATIGAATDRYHFVYQVSAARQNTAVE
jgi:hypothetical protein